MKFICLQNQDSAKSLWVKRNSACALCKNLHLHIFTLQLQHTSDQTRINHTAEAPNHLCALWVEKVVEDVTRHTDPSVVLPLVTTCSTTARVAQCARVRHTAGAASKTIGDWRRLSSCERAESEWFQKHRSARPCTVDETGQETDFRRVSARAELICSFGRPDGVIGAATRQPRRPRSSPSS